MKMLGFSLPLIVAIVSSLICQSSGRALDENVDENLLELTFSSDVTTTTEHLDCRCVSTLRCASYFKLIANNTGGENLLNPRSPVPSCTNPQHICCEPDAITSTSTEQDVVVHTLLPRPTRECECTAIKNCEIYAGTIIKNTNGEGLINPRFGECADSQHICCDKLRQPREVPSTFTRKPKTCGVRNEDGIGFKMTSNTEAQFAEFPYIVVLFKHKVRNGKETLQFTCGGSLIHLKIVLTAAHCVRSYVANPHLITVRAGEWDTESTSETAPHQERVAEKIITHPQFNSGSKAYDVALVVLKEQFEFADNVDIVCLPPQGAEINRTDCVAAGWGKDSFDADRYSNILRKLDLPYVPKDKCQSIVSAAKPSSAKLHESIICAGGQRGIDVCQGDGGGPLLCPVPNTKDDDIYQQVGIISYGYGCGEEIPSFYANVPLVRNWIDDEVANNGLEKTGFYQLELTDIADTIVSD